jgi:Flp pilus assembly protein TadG
MVESALVLTAILCMIIFILDMGRLLLTQQFISERARATARAAAVRNWTAAEAANYLVFNSSTAPAGATFGIMGLKPSNVSFQKLGASGAADYRVQVRVTGVPVSLFIPFMAGTYTAAPVTVTVAAQSMGATT